MKFAKSLLRQEIPEWSQHYIDYKGLKKLVKQIANQVSQSNFPHQNSSLKPLNDSESPNIDESIIAPFFSAIDRNAETVNDFYRTKFSEYTRRLRFVTPAALRVAKQPLKDEADFMEKEELTSQLTELRSQFCQLKQFAEANQRGFVKILKKFDKKVGTRAKSPYLAAKIGVLEFSQARELSLPMEELSKLLDVLTPLNSTSLSPTETLLSTKSSETSLSALPFDSLRQAVDSNDVQTVKQNLDLLELSPKQVTALGLRALNCGAIDVLALLAQQRATQLRDVVSEDGQSRNFVHKAVIAASRSVLPADLPFARGLKALLRALSLDVPLESLLSAQDFQNRTPLHYAARYGLPELSKLLISEFPAALSYLDADRHRPTALAVLHRHPAALREILVHDKSPQFALLLTAAQLGDYEVCKALIEANFDVNVRNSANETPLHLAVKHGHSGIVEILIANGANLEARERTYDWTPLFVAAVDGATTMVEQLLAAGAQPRTTDLSGWSPREHAAFRGHIKLAEQLPAPPTLPPVVASSKAPPLPSPPLPPSGCANVPIDEPLVKTFGHKFLKHPQDFLVLLTLGSRDRRLRGPIVQFAADFKPASTLAVSCSAPNAEKFKVDLNAEDHGLATEPLAFYTNELANLQIVFDLVSSCDESAPRARGVFVLPPRRRITDLNQLQQTAVLVEVGTLRVVGSVRFEYLVVQPFGHPNNGLNCSSTYWRSLITTRVIGHRGLGKNTLEQSSLQLGENTVESFVQAANLGASYVEFDVQVTKDGVPVIYHDFLVGDSGFDVPMHAVTHDQFMNIHRPLHRGRPESPSPPNQSPLNQSPPNQSNANQSPPNQSPPIQSPLDQSAPTNLAPKRSRSVSDRRSASDRPTYYDEAVQRMKYTRDFRTKGFKGNLRGLHIQSQFATLAELFKTLPTGLGFNIEFKYPMPDEAESEDMDGTVLEINLFVDTILKVIFDLKNERDVILSSFNPDVCALLSLKQPSLPVLFLTEAGTEEMQDVRASSLQEAIRFARRFSLLGIVSGAAPLILCPRLVRAVKENGLVCFTYGTENNVPENAKIQLRHGVDAVIVDSVLAIRQELTSAPPSETLISEVERATEQLSELNCA